MSTTRLTTPERITYRGKKYEQLGQKLDEEYEHEVSRRVSHNNVQDARYARVSTLP